MAQKFAVFDIDGTIIRTALFLQIVDELLAAGHLDKELRINLDAKLEAYRTRAHQTAFQDYNEAAVDALFSSLKHLLVADYRTAVDAVIKRSHAQVYSYTRDLIHSLKAQGYFLIAMSGSEQYSIESFTAQYDFNLVIGDVYKEENGRFTGKIDSIFSDKGQALKKIMAENQLAYKDSVAIGDSYGDAKMLELVEKPIAFNPEAKLFELAKEKSWPIVIERKNVIYTLEPQKGQKGSDGSYILA